MRNCVVYNMYKACSCKLKTNKYFKNGVQACDSVMIVLCLTGKLQPYIVRELKHLKVNKMLVYRTISRINGIVLKTLDTSNPV